MTENAQSTEGRQKAQPVEKLNVDEPIWVAIDQAETRTYIEPFNGWDAEQKCREYAADRSARLKRKVIIVGPQVGIAKPPENPVGLIEKVVLSKPAETED